MKDVRTIYGKGNSVQGYLVQRHQGDIDGYRAPDRERRAFDVHNIAQLILPHALDDDGVQVVRRVGS